MVKNLAIIFGIVLVVLGVAGFIPALAPSGMLFGVFAVDAMHNTVHLLTGAIALAVGLSSERASTVYFQIFGVIYAILAVLGFARGSAPIMGMANNYADAGLHLLIAVVTLYIGFIHSHMHWRGGMHWPHWRH